MITEIFVENNKLDITADISSLLTFAIDDVQDFSSRQTTFSKTIVLPGTANNNAIFGNVFELGISNNYDETLSNIGFNFNPSKSAKCIIFQDNLQTFKGTLRILEIDITKGRIEYEVALNGDMTTLNVALSSAYLTDLDFSEHNLTYNTANIIASWDNAPGSGVYFPLIDYGTYSALKHDWDFHTFRPALYVKEYIDKMFAATSQIYNVISFSLGSNPTIYVDVAGNGVLSIVTGDGVFLDQALTTVYPDGTYSVVGTDFTFTVLTGFVTTISNPSGSGPGTPVKYPNPNGNFRYECDLFNTDRFKRLIVPHNQKNLTKPTSTILNANLTTADHIINHFSDPDDVIFGSILGGLFTNVGGKVFTYTGTDTITTTLKVNVAGTYTFHSLGTPYNLRITIQRNGVQYYYDGIPIDINTGISAVPYSRAYTVPLTLAPGTTFSLNFAVFGGPVGPCDVYVNYAAMNITSASVVTAPLDYGDLIELKYSIPQTIRQVDFLSSIVKLFNLYVYEDQFDDRLIKIAPFVDFYSPSTSHAIDWTYKLNRDQPMKIKPLSELNSKLYYFNYAADTDYWNDLYQKRYNQVYGSYIFDSQYEFADQTNTLELIFAPTPLIGYVGEDKIYPTIFKMTGTVVGVGEENIDSVIRIMQTKKMFGLPSWNILNAGTVIASSTNYGYAGHLDDPENPDNDLNFGALQELFFILTIGDFSKTQFNIYWSAYMAEITDKDSKLLTAKFYLNPIDIFNLDFSQFIYVDGVLFRLNKITDYNVTTPSDCEVELLKVINTAYSYPLGSVPEDDRTLDDATGDELEYTSGNAILYY